MIQITEENWDNLNKLYQDKIDKIKSLELKVKGLETHRDFYLKKLSDNETSLTKSEDKLKISEANLSLVLNKLNECMLLLEKHGLITNKREQYREVTGFNVVA